MSHWYPINVGHLIKANIIFCCSFQVYFRFGFVVNVLGKSVFTNNFICLYFCSSLHWENLCFVFLDFFLDSSRVSSEIEGRGGMPGFLDTYR